MSKQPASTIAELMREQARTRPAAPAILAPGRPALTFAGLWQQASELASALQSLGVTPSTRVAVVLPNGPEMAVAFLGTSMCSTCAPLNPAYPAAELRFYLEDLGAKVLIVQAGDAGPAGAVARELGLTVLEVGTDTAQPAGHLRIALPNAVEAVPSAVMACADDIALVLHTSGTTARPKIVPLTQANLVASAHNIARHLALQPADRCLNVMPLFHIHGLVGALLSTMASGGSIVCTPGFDAHLFFDWTAQFDPTWYSAVPTIHQSLLENGAEYRLKAPQHRFRFVRSSSAALAPAVFHRLQELTGAPVIEAYGMTEASHQMTSNPLPSGVRKPGSVGLAAGVDVALMSDGGDLLAPGETGEIVIRGPGVFAGYENNPQANASSFTDGWFRTGDQGRIDGEGYLFILGRLKEIVNRGGEKISPREVDEALLEHPDVAQATAFGRPHPSLGEDLAAAVVLRSGAQADEAALRAFLFERLAAFKVPSVIALVDAIPKGPTGKVQRNSLYEKLRDRMGATLVEASTDIERSIQAIFSEALGVDPLGANPNFFAAGGDSLTATRVVARINERHGTALAATEVFHHPTIATLAAKVLERQITDSERPAQPQRQANASEPQGASPSDWREPLEGMATLEQPTDRPRPARMSQADSTGPTEQRSALEAFVLQVWRKVLNRDSIGLDDNFFDLGGHSLLAMRVASRIEAVLRIEIRVQLLFEATSVAQLCAVISRDHPDLQVPEAPPGSDEVSNGGPEPEQLQAADRTDCAALMPGPYAAPLSCAQEGLWFLDRITGPSGIYNIAQALRLFGTLNVAALEGAVRALVQRHESLRTAFLSADGMAVQAVRSLDEVSGSLQLDANVLDGDTAAQRERALAEALRDAAAEPFALACAPLLRVRLWRTGEHEHALLLVLHHIVSDGWSMGILARELGALYVASCAGHPDPLAPLPRQFTDYAVWQRQRLSEPGGVRDLAYWRAQLAGLEPLQLHTDRARAPRANHQGDSERVEISPDTLVRLKALARRENATLFMVLLAAFQVLLMRHSGQHDVAVGSPVAGRHRTIFEGLIGYFVNTIVLRNDLSGNPGFAELLARVRLTCLQGYEHQEQPFDRLVAELSPQRDLSRNPLYQVAFVLHNTPPGALNLGNLRSEPLPVHNATAKFDLSLSLGEEGGHLRGTMEYRTQLFDAATIERLISHFGTLLEGIVAAPEMGIEQLPLMTRQEHELLMGWSGNARVDPQQPNLHQLFELQARCHPDAVAVAMAATSLSFAELNERANRLAHHLQTLGVGPDVLVGLCLPRSLDMIVALLAILKAGGAYVPLDPEYPSERLAFMLADTAAPVLITEQALRGRLPESRARVLCIDSDAHSFAQCPDSNPLAQATADHLAYVIYTSGSTGTPKGVMVTHRAVARLVIDTDYVLLGPDDVVAQASNSSFDAATFEIWGALLNGAKLTIVSKDVLLSGAALAREIAAHRITTLFLTTSVFNEHAANSPGMFSPLKQLLFGGEAVDPAAVRRVLDTAPPRRLLNGYGPTETTTFATWFEAPLTSAEVGARVPIGRPIANTRCRVLDARLEPVPVGIVGELYIGGPGLARGYLNRPELTAERFVDDPWLPGERLYRTGDLVRYRPDGNLDCVGRADRQVKLRGFRIELGEIEAALAACAGVRQALVVLGEDLSGTARLVAYVVSPDGVADTGALVAELKQRLPDHMIPSAIVALRTLPLTPNGKLDHKALPAPGFGAHPGSPPCHVSALLPDHEPTSPLEHKLSAIWCDVLGLESIGVQDDFFELGGHSLLAIRLLTRIDQALGSLLNVSTLFQAPTVRQLAAVIEQQIDAPDSCVVSLQPRGALKAVFTIAGYGGGVMPFRALARELGMNRPLCVLDTGVFGLTGEDFTLEELARRMIVDMRQWQPEGPYHLVGYSLGGNIAFEMARQLHAAGVKVGLLALLDSGVRGFIKQAPFAVRTWLHVRHGLALKPAEAARYLGERVSRLRKYFTPERQQIFSGNAEASTSPAIAMQRSADTVGRAWKRYVPSGYAGAMLLIRAEVRPSYPGLIDDDPEMGWGPLVEAGVQLESMQCAHLQILKPNHAATLATILVKHLARVEPDAADDREPLGSGA